MSNSRVLSTSVDKKQKNTRHTLNSSFPDSIRITHDEMVLTVNVCEFNKLSANCCFILTEIKSKVSGSPILQVKL